MKILTMEQVKAHLRIEDSFSDDELTLICDGVEQQALQFMQRSYDSLIVEFGSIPADIKLACLARIASEYKHREDVTDRALTRQAYGWECKLLKYTPKNKI